ncbi:MAG: tRNA ligase [Marteilia pararefringens]
MDVVMNSLSNYSTPSQCPNYSLIIERLHNWQDQALRPKSTNKRSNCGIDCFSNFAENFTLSIGIPVMPMLAHPCKDFESVLTRFKDRSFIGEYKYDGERAQIHYSNSPSNHVEIFSRNCENSTAKFPDIKSSIISLVETFNVAIEKKTDKSTEKILNFIIDCEIVAYSSENQTILPFQILSTRKRKDVEVADIKVQVALIIFDIILFNNKSLVKETLPRRKKLIAKLLESYPKTDVSPPDESDNINQHVILQSEWRHIKSSEALQNFFEESINNSCEGLMLKTFDDDSSSNYEISSRSRCWLKLKKDYLEGSGDSLDLVPIGAYMGEGKRKGVYGAYLLATYDSNTQNYIAIARCGSGFSEECLKDLYEEINCESSNLKHYSDSKPAAYIVPKHLFPDVWLCASKVFEIRAADLTLSPLYQVAFGSIEESKGISLRFPRFLNQRSDKSPQQSTSPSEILELYKNQKSISGHDSNERKGGNNPKYSKLEIEDMNESDTESEEDDEDDDPYN